MNKEWSEKNKTMQSLLKKNTFSEGIEALLELRGLLMEEILSWKNLPREAFSAMPFPKAEGYHSKTVAYSLWHIFRIEDIVVNSLIRNAPEVLFSGAYGEKMHASIITTGNELKGEEIAAFSRELDLEILYRYIGEVKDTTDAWLKTLDYAGLKQKFGEADQERLGRLGVVSRDEEAAWLIDYWCGKDVKGLLQMPLSRHWIMHMEGALRIIKKVSRGDVRAPKRKENL